jgi:preprotein translocase subunit SecG
METVIIVVHLMVVLALVGVVLLQRSEGGGLGIGGGSGFMTARGAANALTRATAILAAAFFITSLGLSLIARYGAQPIDILDRVPPAGQGQGQGGVLDQLGGGSDVPAPPATAPAAPGGMATPPADAAAPAAPAAPEAAPANPPAAAAPPATDVPAAPEAAPATPAQPAAPQVPN